MSASITWSHPVALEPIELRRVQLEVERLATQLFARWDQESAGFGLSHGKVGLGFAMFELADSGMPRADEFAERAVFEGVEQFNSKGADPGLHHGLAGLGWLLDAWVGEEPLCGLIDHSLRDKVERMTELEPSISLREGLIGIGLYAARRAERVSSARVLLETIAARLNHAAQPTSEGLTWNTSSAYLHSRGGDHLFRGEPKVIREFGVAHGVAPIALLLSQMEQLQVSTASSTREALRWLWSSTKTEPNRFGWIHSDEGVLS